MSERVFEAIDLPIYELVERLTFMERIRWGENSLHLKTILDERGGRSGQIRIVIIDSLFG